MSGKLASARDLSLQLLSQMLWVERMLAFEVLPQLHEQVQSESLAALVADHRAQTRDHVARLEAAFGQLGVEAASARHAPAAAASDQHQEIASQITDPRLADLFHAGAAIQSEHLELAGYELLLELLRALERDEVVDAVEQNRTEDARALEQLRKVAERLRDEVDSAGEEQ
jgi:ferritin-like metal-binding protein YciE